MNDKKKIVILSLIIGFVVILIILVGVIIYLSIMNDNKVDDSRLSTTTRRTVTTDEKNMPVTNLYEEPATTTTSTTTTTTTVMEKTSTKKITTTTTKKTTTKKVATTSSVIPYPDEREVTTESTDFPNADDAGAWKIVDLINEARIKNGLSPVSVAVELRRLAEEAADYWQEYSDDEIKDYLYGHSNYRRKSNVLSPSSAYLTMYEQTIKNTNITTNKNIKYVGIGLIYQVNGISGLGTHYYVIIYE